MAVVPQFPDVPSDRRTPEQRAAQRAKVREQMDRWIDEMAAGREPRVLKALVADLGSRRATMGVGKFDVVEDEFPVAPNRLLVRAADAATTGEALTGRFDPQDVPIPGLDDVRVFQDIGAGERRFRTDRAEARRLADRSTSSYSVLLGAVRKAKGGPELSGPADGQLWEFSPVDVRGPRVVIIDNGVSAERRSDGWLAGLARADNLDLLNVFPQDDYLDRAAGHGTFVAGIVQQVAPGADLDMRSALDTDGVGDDVEIAQQIVRAAQDGAEIINLSLGVLTPDDEPPLVLEAAVRTAIRIAEDNGRHLLLVCAAGNFGDERRCWPAALSADPEFARHVVSVAALRPDYEAEEQTVGAEWSSRGDWVTCSTLGQGVVSTYVVGEEAREYDTSPETFRRNAWATWSGTSFAAPQVVGAIVRIMQRDGFEGTARTALDQLLDSGTEDIPGYGSAIRILPV